MFTFPLLHLAFVTLDSKDRNVESVYVCAEQNKKLSGLDSNINCQTLWFLSISEILDCIGSIQNIFSFTLDIGIIVAFVLQKNEWRKFRAPKGVQTPKGRRSHTATVFQDSLYIYGGYQDLKGSSSELWSFHFGKEHEYCRERCFYIVVFFNRNFVFKVL